jgi:hypothetical protein
MRTLLALFILQATCQAETLAEIGARLGSESSAAFSSSPYSSLSKDYFARFSRDPEAGPVAGETAIDANWRIVLTAGQDALVKTMAGHLDDFLAGHMGFRLETGEAATSDTAMKTTGAIILLESGGGDGQSAGSFTLSVEPNRVIVQGKDAAGLRDGVVHLVDLIGFREAPFLARGSQVYKPRLQVRLGAIPSMGSYRELMFLGYNTVFAGGGSLFALSTSDAIPELIERRNPAVLQSTAKAVEEARKNGFKAFAFIDIRQKFPKDHPVFLAHPDLRGALTWKADGEYVLCTEHPLVKQYLAESIEGLFRAAPGLAGVALIIGGEGFYHCFMRPYGVEKGHTNCPRCEPLGGETVVAGLLNGLAEAARRVNPDAVVVGWPYSAEHVWSKDKDQAGLIEKLLPGTGIFSEIEKDEYVEKPEGVRKHLWDYSIDLIGPGERAKRQIAACKARNIPIYLKSEPELGFEAPRLPHIPCLDRWADRAEALASCGSDGAWVFPAFRPCYGTSAAEVNKFFWWDPVPDKEEMLGKLAKRIAGNEAGPALRKAWRHVSEAIPYSPELPSYYTGPYYLGPAHPMCADPEAKLPEVFYGRYLFMAEMTDSEGVKLRPTFVTSPTGNVPVFGKMYRAMEACLKQAVDEIEQSTRFVNERHRLMFESEASPIRWFYHTARTEANFYESCQLRDRLLALAGQPSRTPEETSQAAEIYRRWLHILSDERENAVEALSVMEADMRLDFYYGGDHAFPHGADMIRAKLEILDQEIQTFLPSLAQKCGIVIR